MTNAQLDLLRSLTAAQAAIFELDGRMMAPKAAIDALRTIVGRINRLSNEIINEQPKGE
jgi:hypothetical protein